MNGLEALNFGWGRSRADARGREGTFEIDKVGNSIGRLPADEAGFVEPVAEFGREGTEAIAVSGPLHSARSLPGLSFLFADLVSGQLFATTGPPSSKRQDVVRVRAVDGAGQPVTLRGLARADRPSPRLFSFPDGSAGILLEPTGEFFRVVAVP